ncbi:MAG: outer membrane beta-barrel protein, partial [Sandaracinobacteroides sp.]
MLKLLTVIAHIAAGALASVATADTAAAQSLPSPFVSGEGLLRADVAGNRAIPGYAASGLALGGFTVQPELALRAALDSNVLNLSENGLDDAVLLIEPRLKLKATPGRHRFDLVADARVARFADLTGENSETFGVSANAQLEVSAAASLSAVVRA